MPNTRAARAVVVGGGGLDRKNGLGNNGAAQRMAKRKAEDLVADARTSRGKKRAALGEITNVRKSIWEKSLSFMSYRLVSPIKSCFLFRPSRRRPLTPKRV